MHEYTSALIDELIALRKTKGLSQRQLAALVGTSQVVIARLESKKQPPTIETLNKILEVMDAKLTIEEITKDKK